MFGNMALNIVMASSLQYLWGAINTLQIFILCKEFGFSLPANALMIMDMLEAVAKFDVIPLGDVERMMFNYTETYDLH